MNNGFLTGFVSFSENFVEKEAFFFWHCPLCGALVEDGKQCTCLLDKGPLYGIWEPAKF